MKPKNEIHGNGVTIFGQEEPSEQEAGESKTSSREIQLSVCTYITVSPK